jgi:hypothetical protein
MNDMGKAARVARVRKMKSAEDFDRGEGARSPSTAAIREYYIMSRGGSMRYLSSIRPFQNLTHSCAPKNRYISAVLLISAQGNHKLPSPAIVSSQKRSSSTMIPIYKPV